MNETVNENMNHGDGRSHYLTFLGPWWVEPCNRVKRNSCFEHAEFKKTNSLNNSAPQNYK